jgi:rhodanese-related sulfurtransferase
VKQVLLEAALVALVGAALAFAANGLSPQGIKLGRDYFPGASKAGSVPRPGTAPAEADTNRTPTELLAARLKQNGLQLIGTEEVLKLFHDPRREQDLVVFVDARSDASYQAGHIPGAYQFDHFHYENYLAAVVPVCLAAQQIVVYCHGGDCADSENAALMLSRDAGIPREKLFVYGGGITEWTERGLPVESGARKSLEGSGTK